MNQNTLNMYKNTMNSVIINKIDNQLKIGIILKALKYLSKKVLNYSNIDKKSKLTTTIKIYHLDKKV